jgi:DNA-binding NarL/FixJ family response regulator
VNVVMPVSMVGRAAELDELVRAWSLVAGAPLPVVITGAAGIGKSLLVAAALDALNPRPATILAGAARVHTPAPYDWLAAVLSRPFPLPVVPAAALAWLTQDPDVPRERYAPGALLRQAVRIVRELVGTGPAVLLVEDLHALDPASLNLIGDLATAPDLPVLLIVASRPPDTTVVARTLARLSGVPGAIRQHLGPLDTTEVTAILSQVYPESAVTPGVARAVRDRTGGNPYWLTELLATARDGDPEALVHEPVPSHVRLAADTPPELTAREVEVLACIAAGMSNKQVARSLGISIRTVTVHVSNLLRKTGSASRTEAALWAVQHDSLMIKASPKSL